MEAILGPGDSQKKISFIGLIRSDSCFWLRSASYRNDFIAAFSEISSAEAQYGTQQVHPTVMAVSFVDLT